MSRRAVNPWQKATALGRRLRVSVDATGAGATWTHPDDPTMIYAVSIGEESGEWTLSHGGVMVDAGTMDGAVAALFVSTARAAEPRRLAGWKMMNAEGLTW